MAWRYTKAGKAIERPSSERGLHVEGPLTVDDWQHIQEGIVEEMIAQAVREAKESPETLLTILSRLR